jgi:hypothetical protein
MKRRITMFGRRRQEPGPPSRPTIADECEAFLAGTIADLYEASGRTVPCWAQLNRLAHATRVELHALVATTSRPTSPRVEVSWDVMLHRLARQLTATPDDRALAASQRRLCELEGDLISAPNGPVQTPGELLRIVVSVLSDDRQTRG